VREKKKKKREQVEKRDRSPEMAAAAAAAWVCCGARRVEDSSSVAVLEACELVQVRGAPSLLPSAKDLAGGPLIAFSWC
jgi:hypothetical protein